MRVSRIEIFGFKSFMDRTVLSLGGGLIGVVGPNGCGKSNIVDAIKWVLGETRARSLRGSVFEDVIFNGTDKLRPLGLAEVAITVQAKSESFFDEILPNLANDEIAESLAKIDEAENELNKIELNKVMPLEKEILEKEANKKEANKDNNNNTPKLSVVVNNSKASSSKEETIKIVKDVDVDLKNVDLGNSNNANKTNNSVDNNINDNNNDNNDNNNDNNNDVEDLKEKSMTLLSRFSWLQATSEVQVTRRLYRSGESEYFINRVPCRLKDLKELFRAIGIGARAYTIVAQNEVTRIITAKPEERRQMLEEAAGVLGFKDKIVSANKRLDETLINVSRLNDIMQEVARGVNNLKRQSQRAIDRKGLLERLKEVDLTLFKDSYFNNCEIKSNLEAQKERLKEEELVSKNGVDVIKLEEEALRLSMLELDSEGEEYRLKIDSIKEELNRRERKLIELRSGLKERLVRKEALETENERLDERKEMLAKRREEARSDFEKLEAEQNELKEKLQSVEAIGEEDLKAASLLVEETKAKLNEKERELKKVNDSYISIKARLEAIEEQLIAASPVSQLKKTLGNQGATSEFLEEAKGTKLFLDGISIPSKYAKALQAVLGEKTEFLVSKEPQKLITSFNKMLETSNKKGLGIGIFKENENEFTQNLKKDINIPFPLILDLMKVSLDVERSANNILKNVYVIENIKEGISFFEANNNEKFDDVLFVSLEGELLTSYSYYSLKHEGGLVQLKSRKEEYQKEFSELSKELSKLNNEKSILFEDAKKAEFSYRQELDEVKKRQLQIREISNKLANAKGRFESHKRLVSQLDYDLEKLESQYDDIKRRDDNLSLEIENISKGLREAENRDEQELKDSLVVLDNQYKQVNIARGEKRSELSDFNNRLDDARKRYDMALRASNNFELNLQRVSIELENIEKNIIEKYSRDEFLALINIDEEYIKLEEEEKFSLVSELNKIKARIEREGPVDPTATERYSEEKERLEELERQKNDLEKAIDILGKTIDRLVQTSQTRFMNVFTRVRENFRELAPRLFGGGLADIELSDPQKPLESGVDIIARPPGKKLKSLELLSGGEKTLCAIALILATFLERPSPLCVLDEVDAPLDEANLMRFLILIKELSTRTQVIVITHNKQTMMACSELIGVTMQEPGATKLIAVSLEDAIKEAV
ncbi:MAG: chromosome segregation SMC family protein [Bdellovibrionota bacterium]